MTDTSHPNPNLVEARALTRVFSSRASLFGKRRSMAAVSSVDLDVPRGQVTGVVGESGCGKSTLARLVLRLIEASSGSVHFDGTDLASLPASGLRTLRRRMQMVFQGSGFKPQPATTDRHGSNAFRVRTLCLVSLALNCLRVSTIRARC